MTDDQGQKNAGTATASLILGIASLVCCGAFTGIPAIICGHMAKSKIAKSEGTLKGAGMALAGLVMGYVSLAMTLIAIPIMTAVSIPAFMKARQTATGIACVNNLRMIDGAKEQAAIEHQLPPGAAVGMDMIDGYLKGGLGGTKCPAGGVYSVSTVGEPPACSIHGDLETAQQALQGGR